MIYGAAFGGAFAFILLALSVAAAAFAHVAFPRGFMSSRPALLYDLSGVMAGALGGALLPATRSKRGAILVGILALQPFMAMMALFDLGVEDLPHSAAGTITAWLLTSLGLGPVVGLHVIRPWSGRWETDHRPKLG